jgi:hypothetical protein
MLEMMKALASLDADKIMATVNGALEHALAAREAVERIEKQNAEILALLRTPRDIDPAFFGTAVVTAPVTVKDETHG